MDNFNVFNFFLEIFNVLKSGATAVYNILSYHVPITGIVNVIVKLIDFFGGDTPEWLTDLATSGLSIMTIAGVSFGVVIIIIIIKKIIPFL